MNEFELLVRYSDTYPRFAVEITSDQWHFKKRLDCSALVDDYRTLLHANRAAVEKLGGVVDRYQKYPRFGARQAVDKKWRRMETASKFYVFRDTEHRELPAGTVDEYETF